MKTQEQLRKTLEEIDNKGYGAYKELKGEYQLGHFVLLIDYVQGDPFASPSKVRLRIPKYKADFPEKLYDTKVRRLALEDYLARHTKEVILDISKGNRGSGKSGKIYIDGGAQEVLERTACEITNDFIELRLEMGLPAAGRRILGKVQADAMLCTELPEIASKSLIWSSLPQQEVYNFVQCIENQEHIRSQLDSLGLLAFVADGSVLPRKSGASDKPMEDGEVVKFKAPEALRVSFTVPNTVKINGEKIDEISGMAIPKGVTLITGGGYHGKSTLLNAIERGVYPHIPGDGREYVISNPDLVKVRSEDGRRVEKVDISPFIELLPTRQDTEAFSSNDASGSTSQAANIIEAVELGVEGVLVDEDTSATNFMIRDARMQALVHKENEPITPFLDRVREMYEEEGISTVLVMGGSGDYFDVADTVIMMRDFLPFDVTEQAREIAGEFENRRQKEEISPFNMPAPRIPLASSFKEARGRKKRLKIRPRGLHKIQYGVEDIELQFVEQLVDRSQTNAIGEAIRYAVNHWMEEEASLEEIFEQLYQKIDEEGLDFLCPFGENQHPGNFAKPRKFEIAAAINRLRVVEMKQKTGIKQ